MTDSTQKHDRIPGEKHDPSTPRTASAPSGDSVTTDNKAEVITEKFLAVAKEKNNLESIIMSQSDRIKELEKEKEKVTLSLKKFTTDHKSMREKLLDFDILRNMEISELKKKIELVMADNKKLISEKNAIVRNLDRDKQNMVRVDNQAVISLMREKRELEAQLRKTLGDGGTQDEQKTQAVTDGDSVGYKASLISFLRTYENLETSIAAGELDREQIRDSLKTAAADIRELERELSLTGAQTAEIELDRDEARAELYNSRVEIEHLKADKAHVEKKLQQKVDDYSKEIAELRTDVDELTSAIEIKVHVINELKAKVVQLGGELSHKDSELHEKIPALLEKINSLSQSIDMKMEESSLFSKELFDLNVKLTALNEEMIEKDELLIDISVDYKKQKDEIEALHGAHELTLRNLVYERDLLKRECEELRSSAEIPLQQLNNEQGEQKVLEGRLSETLQAIDELSSQNTGLSALISEKDAVISDLQREALLMASKVEGAAAEYTESLAALQEQFLTLNQQLLEKDNMLNALTTEQSQSAEKDQALAGLQSEILLYQSKLEGATAEHASNLASLREKIIVLNQQILEKQELLTVMASEREYDKNEFLYQTELLRKEKTDLDSEMKRLIERGMEQEENLTKRISLLDAFQKERARYEEDLARAAKRINELLLEQDRLASFSAQKEQALSDSAREITVLQVQVASLQASQAELEKMIAEKQESSGPASAAQEALQRTACEYQEAFEHLKEEIISLNKRLADKEQEITLLLSERKGLARNSSDQKEKLAQHLASIQDLQIQLNESRRDNDSLSAEQRGLATAVSRLQAEILSLNRTREEEVKVLKDDLSSYSRAVADLRLKLEQGLNENADLKSKLLFSQNVGQEVPTPVFEKREETLPARVEKTKPAGKRSFAYILLALLLIGGIGFSFYLFNTGIITPPMEKPAVREEAKKELTYTDMYSMLTKASVSDDLKFQATLLTEDLILKSNAPGEKALFDFQHNLYFKVSISAPRQGLDDEIAEDPYSMITLSAGAAAVKPLTQVHSKDIKTFYRKEEPVSIMFYCAFPRTALTAAADAFSLSFRTEKDKADIVWNLKALRAGNLLP